MTTEQAAELIKTLNSIHYALNGLQFIIIVGLIWKKMS